MRAIADDWNGLLRRSRADSLFLTWEWMAAWRSTVGDSLRPFVVVVRSDHGALVGIAPFCGTSYRLLAVVPYRMLGPLADAATGAEYADWILDPACEADAARAIVQALAGVAGGWDCLWIPKVAGWTGARARILDACAAAGFYCQEREQQFAAVDLPGDFPAYERTLSRNARSMLRRRARQLSDKDTELVHCRTDDERLELLNALAQLHNRHWAVKGEGGAFFRRPLATMFYHNFTRLALERGWLRLAAIRVGRELKAVQIGYVYNRTFYQLQEGFDPTAPAGLGNVLRAQIIEDCIREGVTTYDFLGGFTEHKRRWLARPRTGHDLLIGRRTLKNRALFAAGVWPTGRFLRRWEQPA